MTEQQKDQAAIERVGERELYFNLCRIEDHERNCACDECQDYKALARVLTLAKRPYALSGEERKVLSDLRESRASCVAFRGDGVSQWEAITNALNMAGLFTRDALKHIQKALQLSEETVLDSYDPCGEDQERRSESGRLFSAVTAMIAEGE